MRVIVAATPDNTAPVAADSTETVTENTYGKINTGSYTNVASASTDADGDTLTVTQLKYDKWIDTNNNGIINTGEIQETTETVNSGWNTFNTRYGQMWIHSNGDYSFNAALQEKVSPSPFSINTYDSDNTLAYGAYNAQFDEVNKLDLGESATLSFTCLLYTSPSPRDRG